MRIALALSLGLAWVGLVACGGNTNDDGNGGAGSGGLDGGIGGAGGSVGGAGGASGGSGGIDCSNVGCAQPPMCDVGCQETCGCCSCGEGSEEPTTGGYLECTGGCWTFVAAKTCGGLAGASCAADEWCDLQQGCGFPDAQGICKKRPQGCPKDCTGACGCDGKGYCNTCAANAAGQDTSSDTDCLLGKACSTDTECAPGLKCCYPCGLPGCQNECTVPVNGACPMYQ